MKDLDKLKKQHNELQSKLDKVNSEIEEIEPKKAKTYGDPIVELY